MYMVIKIINDKTNISKFYSDRYEPSRELLRIKSKSASNIFMCFYDHRFSLESQFKILSVKYDLLQKRLDFLEKFQLDYYRNPKKRSYTLKLFPESVYLHNVYNKRAHESTVQYLDSQITHFALAAAESLNKLHSLHSIITLDYYKGTLNIENLIKDKENQIKEIENDIRLERADIGRQFEIKFLIHLPYFYL